MTLLVALAGCSGDADGDAVVASTAATVPGTSTSSSQVRPADSSWPVPSGEEAASALDQLAADGAAVSAAHAASLELVSGRGVSPDGCRELASRLADGGASPDVMLDQASRVPDEVLREALFVERTALGVALTACSSGQAEPGHFEALEEAAAIVDSRVQQLESAR